MEPTRPQLVLNPGDDRRFADLAEQLVSGGHTTADALQAALRETFPATVVRPRELSHEVGIVWYVYREGRWVSPGEARRGSGSERDRRDPYPRRGRTGPSNPTGRASRRAARSSRADARDLGSGASNRGR